MSGTYDDLLIRLVNERRRLSLSQKEMGRFMRMSQSNYSKVELGKRRLSYYELKYLCDSEIDLHYVFTGKRCSLKYQDYFETCSYSQLLCLLSIAASLTELYCVFKQTDNDRLSSVWTELSRFADRGQKLNHTLFGQIRKLLGHSQKEMAERIGMDVKKLRELENGRCQPDSELLCRMYELFGVLPAVVLQDRRGLISEICCLMESFDSNSEKEILMILRGLRKESEEENT